MCILYGHLLLLSMRIKNTAEPTKPELKTNLETTDPASQHDGLSEIIHQGLDDKKQGVGVWETGEVFTAVVVDYDLLPVSLL